MALRVGIDLTDVDEVRASLDAFGDAYLRRVYTDAERARCGTNALRLATHFAAKEATMKALEPTDRLPWRSIELAHDSESQPSVSLTGQAAEWAEQLGGVELSISVARADRHAAAVVIARAG